MTRIELLHERLNKPTTTVNTLNAREIRSLLLYEDIEFIRKIYDNFDPGFISKAAIKILPEIAGLDRADCLQEIFKRTPKLNETNGENLSEAFRIAVRLAKHSALDAILSVYTPKPEFLSELLGLTFAIRNSTQFQTVWKKLFQKYQAATADGRTSIQLTIFLKTLLSCAKNTYPEAILEYLGNYSKSISTQAFSIISTRIEASESSRGLVTGAGCSVLLSLSMIHHEQELLAKVPKMLESKLDHGDMRLFIDTFNAITPEALEEQMAGMLSHVFSAVNDAEWLLAKSLLSAISDETLHAGQTYINQALRPLVLKYFSKEYQENSSSFRKFLTELMVRNVPILEAYEVIEKPGLFTSKPKLSDDEKSFVIRTSFLMHENLSVSEHSTLPDNLRLQINEMILSGTIASREDYLNLKDCTLAKQKTTERRI